MVMQIFRKVLYYARGKMKIEFENVKRIIVKLNKKKVNFTNPKHYDGGGMY
jgi:hypothetical protein